MPLYLVHVHHSSQGSRNLPAVLAASKSLQVSKYRNVFYFTSLKNIYITMSTNCDHVHALFG